MITLITPTGGRPEAFSLCCHYIQRQTYSGEIQWLIIDDVQPRLDLEYVFDNRFHIEFLYPFPDWSPASGSTQWRNMILALKKAVGEFVFVIEDDDWYHPGYVDAMLAEFQNGKKLVGMQPTRYYNVQFNAFREFSAQIDRASLCQTAWAAELNSHVVDICKQETWIDGTLWQGINRTPWKEQHGFITDCKVVGIKGMPGRKGFSDAHRDVNRTGWQGDPDRSRLRQWLDKDAMLYDEFGTKRIEEPVANIQREIRLRSFKGTGGQIRYSCPSCEYDHYQQEQVVLHVSEAHREELGLNVPTLFDQDDKPIKKAIRAKFDI